MQRLEEPGAAGGWVELARAGGMHSQLPAGWSAQSAGWGHPGLALALAGLSKQRMVWL